MDKSVFKNVGQSSNKIRKFEYNKLHQNKIFPKA